MPAVPSGKVLVSGANGFVATWVVKNLLDQGYSVRGTVRSQSKIPHLQKIFGSYGDKVEFVVVEDITKPGAFDEYVKDVDAIEHTASPFHYNFEDPNDYIHPAVNGTTSILESALKHGKNVKRVVVTSSVAAVFTVGLPEERTFSEKDWNERSIKEVEEKGKQANAGDKYCASKTLAEKAAWAFVERNKGAIQWDLVTINPPYVFGPVIHEVPEPSALNTSVDMVYRNVFKGEADKETIATFSGSWVDARDVAEAHVQALKKEEAGGNRFVNSAGEFTYQDIINAARKFDSSVPAGNPDFDPSKFKHAIHFDSKKSKEILGLKYHTLEQTTKDMLDDFVAKGWWKSS
ncbi:NAD-P-binding protein [Panus rudis PR-1116 ss-1]|nr:NAD-P-binding protein [Panus rudis PR-1116 ss-1]